MKTILVTPFYWGPIDYFSSLVKAQRIVVDDVGSFKKQSYRNRCYIAGPNGKLMLNLAIDQSQKEDLASVKLITRDSWSQKHWQALQSSYGGSPFFDSIAPDLKTCLEEASDSLLELNLSTLRTCLAWLNHQPEISFLSELIGLEEEVADLREAFHPKVKSPLHFPPYPQVFDHKHGFSPNLSVIDLVCNEGPAAFDYLREL